MKDSTIYAICTVGCYLLELVAVYALIWVVPYSVRPVMLAAAVLAALPALGFAWLWLRALVRGE